jgi:hypothetical protein
MTLTNSIVFSNTAANGGGILNDAKSTPMLDNVTIIDNKANTFGGGVCNLYINPSMMKDVKFINNKTNHGGGMFTVGSDPTLINTIFSGNYASERGGGLTTNNSNPVIINSLFYRNKAGEYGGGLYDSAGEPSLSNVTFSGNSAVIHSCRMVNSSTRSKVSNGIFWDNQDSTGSGTYTATILNDGSTVTLTQSLVQDLGGSDSWTLDSSYVDGEGNIDAEPKFITPVEPNSAPSSDGNLRLKSSSPAVDSGSNNAVTVSTDLDGEPRIVDGDAGGAPTVEMGAYEYQMYAIDIYLPVVVH